MKNQYLADIGDFGKYGLLRFIASKGIRIGVNWYLTIDDGSGDGRFKPYLNQPMKDWMKADEELFLKLQQIHADISQSVKLVGDYNLIPNAKYYFDCLDYKEKKAAEKAPIRNDWFSRSLDSLKDVDLIFADPDNGIIYRAKATTKSNEKYIFPSEVEAYYKSGKDVVFYCHKGRRKEGAWLDVQLGLKQLIPEAHLVTLTYHKGTQRSYIFVIHPDRYEVYIRLLREFTALEWGKDNAFAIEPICYSVKEFQIAYPTKKEKENVLRIMSNEQIDCLISTSTNTYGKVFYSSFKK